MLDLKACQAKFYDDNLVVYPNATQYQYTGSVHGTYWDPAIHPPLLSYIGCRELCGSDTPLYYTWPDVSAAISTWLLPVVTLILQAPFESNAFLATVLAIFHWIGSPISSLAAVLWNIKVCGDCALIVDLAIPFDVYFSKQHGQASDYTTKKTFEYIRDSFYLLSTMNQFSVHETNRDVEDDRKSSAIMQTGRRNIDKRAVAERLVRVVLFSDMLELHESPSLPERRTQLAKTCRDFRRRTVVPLFITLMWFVYSLVTSIMQAFASIGGNITAHSLALGLLLGWIPIFILASVVDRNPTQPGAIQDQLNKLVSDVRRALLDEEIRAKYIKELSKTDSTRRTEQDFAWVYDLERPAEDEEDFFTRFAGQGRVRWHYGIGHHVLGAIKKDFLLRWNIEQGREWLRSESSSERLVTGAVSGFRSKFRPSSVWQLVAALMIFGLPLFGAFTLSYNTPTIGLACRSLGYLIYFVLVVTALFIELLCWFLTDPAARWDGYKYTRLKHRSQANSTAKSMPPHHGTGEFTERSKSWCLSQWRKYSVRDRVEIFILRPIEFINTFWVAYIVLAQISGSYLTCECKCSVWGLGVAGGYLDFQTQTSYLQLNIFAIWASSTALACLPIGICFTYIIHEWCVQSHLSTVNFDAAMKGLKRTRSFRKWMSPVRDVTYKVLDICYRTFKKMSRRGKNANGGRVPGQKDQTRYPSIRWTAKYRPQAESSTKDVEHALSVPEVDSTWSQSTGLAQKLHSFNFPSPREGDLATPADTPHLGHGRMPSLTIATPGPHHADDPFLPSTPIQPTWTSLDMTRVPSQADSIPLSLLDERTSRYSDDSHGLHTIETSDEDTTVLITRPRPVSRRYS